MYCPRCGQPQATDSMRYCARCGLPLEGAMVLLSHGGMLPHYESASGTPKASPRRIGVKQGALLMLVGAVLVPLLGIFSSFAPGRISVAFEFFAAAAAVLCFVGGPLRMLFAALFEERRPPCPQRPCGWRPCLKQTRLRPSAGGRGPRLLRSSNHRA